MNAQFLGPGPRDERRGKNELDRTWSVMANPEHVQILRQGPVAWNRWRKEYSTVGPDLSQLDFGTIQELCMPVPDLSGFDLARADLRMSSLRNAITVNASFHNAYMVSADLCFGHFGHCDFRGAKLRLSRIGSAKFSSCDFTGADLAYCSAEETKFTGSNLIIVDMSHMQLVSTDFTDTAIQDTHVYGAAAWDLKLEGCDQSGIVITPSGASAITVDDLEIAQFVYLLLNNSRLRSVIDTITSKVVLILGRFTPERKAVLFALRNELRHHNLVPILFDFERPSSRSFIETVSTLAHMARFVIGDFTDQGDVRREVQRIADSLQSVPIVPLLHCAEKSIPITLQDLANHSCVLPVFRYSSAEELLRYLFTDVIEPALALERKLGIPGPRGLVHRSRQPSPIPMPSQQCLRFNDEQTIVPARRQVRQQNQSKSGHVCRRRERNLLFLTQRHLFPQHQDLGCLCRP